MIDSVDIIGSVANDIAFRNLLMIDVEDELDVRAVYPIDHFHRFIRALEGNVRNDPQVR